MTDDLPRHMASLWGLDTPARQGRKRVVDLDAIADAGIAIADADGLQAVTMSAVAAAVSVGTMTLYTYVESRDALLVVMSDRIGSTPPSGAGDDDARGWLRTWAWNGVRTFVDHPWLLDIPSGSGAMLTPRTLQWTEAGMVALTSGGVRAADLFAALVVLDGAIRGGARSLLDSAPGRGTDRADAPGSRARAAIDGLIATRLGDYPQLTAAIMGSGAADGEVEGSATTTPFAVAERAIEMALDGVLAP